jgi:hypothetical protein
MSISTKHSAAGSAAGFEQQRRLALVLLAEAYVHDPTVKVRLEVLEDIDLISDDRDTLLVEVKHHLKDQVLTDFSPELWNTVGIWLEEIQGGVVEEWPRFYLMTTAVAKSGSAAAMLGEESRVLEDALDRLTDAARSSNNADTAEARRQFLGLERHIQLRLLERMTVLDGTERLLDLDTRLRRALAFALPRTQTDRFLEGVEGWWVKRSAALLTRAIDFVRGEDLVGFCSAFRDEFGAEMLVAHRVLEEDPTEVQKEPYRQRQFVRQLEVVDAKPDAVDLAIRHYHRAYAQRGRWTRELDDIGDDLDRFENRLQGEWEAEHVSMCAFVGEDETERRKEGLRLALSLGRTATARLRGLDEPVLRHGTLHGLSDDLRVGWHPDFLRLFGGEPGREASP